MTIALPPPPPPICLRTEHLRTATLVPISVSPIQNVYTGIHMYIWGNNVAPEFRTVCQCREYLYID